MNLMSRKTLQEREEVQNLAVLNPDHPLLEKFQQVLKEHLLEQIACLKSDIHEYELTCNGKIQEKDEIGLQAYQTQKILSKQQTILEESVEALASVTAAREALELKLEEEKARQKEVREKLQQVERMGMELQNEVESTNMLVMQMSEWENKVESNITVNQRIAEQTRKENIRLAEEKRKQDMVMYKLMKEVWRLEGELENMDLQLKVRESEREDMALTVAQGNTNIEALQAEQRCLMHSWNSVIVAVGNRDKVLNCLREEETKWEFKRKEIMTEIEQVKKLIKKEQTENEDQSLMKYKLNQDITNFKTKIQDEISKHEFLQGELVKMYALDEQISKDIEQTLIEQRQKENAISMTNKEVNILKMRILDKEQDITVHIDMLVINDKAAENMNKLLREKKTINKDAEMKITYIENKLAVAVTDVDRQKLMVKQTKEEYVEVDKENAALEEEERQTNRKIESLSKTIRKKQAELEMLTNKLEKMLGPKRDQGSPQDLKIIALEKSVEDTTNQIKELQSFWLREQKNLLGMSKERQEQLHDKNILKKQILILEQKNFKITDDLERVKERQEKIERNIRKLQSKTTILCDSLFKKKDQKSDLDRTNDILKNHYDIRLKDSELECLKLQSDIAELESDKMTLSQGLLDLNREILEWEKKIIMVKETKESVKGKTGGEAEDLPAMRTEVHRMEVRYGQLKRAQDKLIIDLEHCVTRRSSIFRLADAIEKKSGENKTKIFIGKKIDDVKNKIKKVENNIAAMEEKTKLLGEEIEKVREGTKTLEEEAKIILEEVNEMRVKTEKTKTNRQLKFELLLMQQKKVSMLMEIQEGRKPFTLYRTEEQLTTEYGRQKDLNNKLCKVVENLTSDFPNYNEDFTRLFNTLRLPVSF